MGTLASSSFMSEHEACRVELLSGDGQAKAPPTEVRIFRAGDNVSRKGVFCFGAKSQEACSAAHASFASDVRQPYPFDYGHAAWHPAPVDPERSGRAAGWHSIEVRNGELWAVNCEWSPQAAAAIMSREWRFLSPSFRHDEEGNVIQYLGSALTNIPALHNPPTLASSRLAFTGAPLMKSLLAALSLPESATEAEALARLNSMLGASASKDGAVLLSTLGASSAADALGRIHALTQASGRVVQLETEVAHLKAAETRGALERLLEEGRRSFKIAPAQEGFWREQVEKHGVGMLQSFLATAPAMVPAQGAPQRAAELAAPGAAQAATSYFQQLSTVQQEVARQLAGGLTADVVRALPAEHATRINLESIARGMLQP